MGCHVRLVPEQKKRIEKLRKQASFAGYPKNMAHSKITLAKRLAEVAVELEQEAGELERE
jgi:hypothetical protein